MRWEVSQLGSRESLDELYTREEDPWHTRSISEKVIRYVQLEKLLPNDKMDMALEIACGEGDFLQKISKRVRRGVGMDVSQTVLKRASRKYPHIEFFNADVRTLEADFFSRFDLITWTDAIYWLTHRESSEVLRKIAVAAEKRTLHLIISSRIAPLLGNTDIKHWPMHDFSTSREFVHFIQDFFPTAKPIIVQLNTNMRHPSTLTYPGKLSRFMLKVFINLIGYQACLSLFKSAFCYRLLSLFIEPFVAHLALVVLPHK
jgi:SAM-dependent methyltransferase